MFLFYFFSNLHSGVFEVKVKYFFFTELKQCWYQEWDLRPIRLLCHWTSSELNSCFCLGSSLRQSILDCIHSSQIRITPTEESPPPVDPGSTYRQLALFLQQQPPILYAFGSWNSKNSVSPLFFPEKKVWIQNSFGMRGLKRYEKLKQAFKQTLCKIKAS